MLGGVRLWSNFYNRPVRVEEMSCWKYGHNMFGIGVGTGLKICGCGMNLDLIGQGISFGVG